MKLLLLWPWTGVSFLDLDDSGHRLLENDDDDLSLMGASFNRRRRTSLTLWREPERLGGPDPYPYLLLGVSTGLEKEEEEEGEKEEGRFKLMDRGFEWQIGGAGDGIARDDDDAGLYRDGDSVVVGDDGI